MKQEIYLDVYVLTNLLMNFTMLYTAGSILIGPLRKLRVILGAFIGTLYATLVLFFPIRGVLGVALWALILLGMCRICLGAQPPGALFSCAAFTLLFSVTAGGILQALVNHGISVQGKMTLTLIATVAVATVSVIRYTTKKAEQKLKQTKARLTLCLKDETVALSAFCDSGNLLQEPITGFPVVLLGKHLQDHALFRSYYSGEIPSPDNFYVIPIQTAAGSRLLYGFRPQELTVEINGRSIRTDRVILAADPACDSFSGCSCLLPASLI